MSIRNLTDVIDSFDSRETAPDVLFLGDSVYLCTSSHDTCTESLANILVRKGDARLKKRAFACGAFHGTMFLEVLDRVLKKPHRPRAVVLPVNIRSFSPQWFHHPTYQFERVRAALQEYDRAGRVTEDFEIRYPPQSDLTAYDRAEHVFADLGKRRLGDFRRILAGKPATPEQAAYRKRAIFTFFYLNVLEPDHPLLATWRNLARELSDRGIHLFAYLTPINKGCGEKYVGSHFPQKVAENAARIGETFTSLSDNPLVHYADWCLDFGQDLFVHEENPDEHLNHKGREILSDRIHTWLQSELSLPAVAAETAIAKADVPRTAGPDEAVFQQWVDLNSTKCNRLYYRDQSAQTLSSLAGLAREFDPSVVVELGTLAGLSLRTWVASTTQAKIHAVDLSFQTLHETRQFLPVDLSRVNLVEQDILQTDLAKLWGPDDRVILFVDAHDLPGVPIMEHVLSTALPSLPDGSIVVVDDLWFSEETLTRDNARAFLDDRVVGEIDELQCFHGHYAPYHEGGSFMGFAEVVPLLKFVNRHGIRLVHEQGGKHVSFIWRKEYLSRERRLGCQECFGSVRYDPLESVPVHPALQELMARIAAVYLQGRLRQAAESLAPLVAQHPQDQGLSYGLAVCLARGGLLSQAKGVLKRGSRDANHPRYQRLLDDLARHLRSSKAQPTEQPVPPTRQSDGEAVTIFAMPKAFAGRIGTIQKNAIRSWTRLRPAPEIILFGDESGIRAMAAEVGARHIPDVGRNEFGTPRVDKLFQSAQEHASHKILAYVNADMILFQDFVESAQKVGARFPRFLLIGQRWDLPLLDEIDYANPQWQDDLRRQMEEHSMLHGESGLDYFIFTRGAWPNIPPFAIGRTAWDNWLVMEPHRNGIPVIDGTEAVTAVHQDHDYGHVAGGRKEAWSGAEAARNRRLAGPLDHSGLTTGAMWALCQGGGLEQTSPRQPWYMTAVYREQRLEWLLKQARRLSAAGADDLAAGKCEEALSLLEALIELSRRGQGPSESVGRERLAEWYATGCVLLAQCSMKMQRYEQVVATYTRLLEHPGIHIPPNQRDDILRVRDRVAALLQSRGSSAEHPAIGRECPHAAPATTDADDLDYVRHERTLDELERKYRSMPDGARGKYAMAVRLAGLFRRAGLHEKSRIWETEASALKEGSRVHRAAELRAGGRETGPRS